MFSISLLFPLNASEVLSFEPWAAICHSRRISSGASKSRGWPEVPSDLEEPQIFLGFLIFTMGVFLSAFLLQHESIRNPFFLTYWEEEGEREGEHINSSVQSLSLCNPMNHSTPGLPVHHQLPEFTQIHAHRVGNAIQPSHPLSSRSPPAPNPSQHQGLSDESTLRMRWPRYWSFSFSISPSNEHPGLICFRMDEHNSHIQNLIESPWRPVC